MDMPMLVRLRRMFKPGPFFDGFSFHFRSSPARLSTRHTLAGLTATMSASSIMNVNRLEHSSGFFRWNAMIACFSESSSQNSRGTQPLCSLTRP
jgi:hypothetical protein